MPNVVDGKGYLASNPTSADTGQRGTWGAGEPEEVAAKVKSLGDLAGLKTMIGSIVMLWEIRSEKDATMCYLRNFARC